MELFTSLEQVPAGFGPSAVTIGKFDGLHIGHRRVLAALRGIAKKRSLISTVITFDRHPLALLRPESCPPPISSNEQKVELLESTGIDALLMLEFTREFSELTPEQFVDSVLVEVLHAAVVFVGGDFRFGNRNAGDVALLTELGRTRGFEVVSIDEVLADDVVADAGQPVSSTLIRDLLARGDVRSAAELLGRPPAVRAIVVHGEMRGRALGYPTANLSPDHEGLIPADGVYAAHLTVDGRTMPAAVSIGNNPTFEGVPDKQVEAHVLDEDLDLYGRRVQVDFVDYVRPMVKFDGIDALKAQMSLDEQRVREILNVPRG
ncbi:MAG: bifunctional riboflavin kinase/FAD synthetase [Microbacteriaceae bacterium]|nr:bifunctional riboflavin kinase/FAD synthetase [Microbacteriaceae bacterium]